MDDPNNPFLNYLKEYDTYRSVYRLKTVSARTSQDLKELQADETFSTWHKGELSRLTELLEKNINLNNKNKTFFIGCNFSNYQANYSKRLNFFLKSVDDSSEIDFIEEEIQFYNGLIEDFVENQLSKNPNKVQKLDAFLLASNIFRALGQRQITITNKKILNFLYQKKELYTLKEESNKFLKVTKTPEVNKLVLDILYKNLSHYSIIKYIEENTTEKTLELFLTELYFAYSTIELELMFDAKIEHVKDALKIFKDRLNYIYVTKGELARIKHFVRKIGNYTTVFNVGGCATKPFAGAIKIVHLNKLMVHYYNNYYATHLDGFGNVSYFCSVVDMLKVHYMFTQKNEESCIEPNPFKDEEPKENDFIRSTIEDSLEPFTDYLSETDYQKLINTLESYFKTSNFPETKIKINFKKINKKKVGWALKEIYKNLKTDKLPIEYFTFAKDSINLFHEEYVDTENFTKSTFYKLFTTKPNS
jgi:hypothetical protein